METMPKGKKNKRKDEKMEGKEQVKRPVVTVTVEKDGKTATYEASGGVAFLLQNDGVSLLSAYACTDLEMAALMDAMMTTALKMMKENPYLSKIARGFGPAKTTSLPLFNEEL